ncbi:SMC family ATPase [Curtobacterium sp. MCSS17_016]|uniref:AAA family ATPase n=1 Tax=Curtobacterium sp. MCSS17_016 TaxID=2175644 RepID=UPI000DA725A0|nr:SMC family ATPase [Curtobacterium sp. MCSS17_016]WIE81525.1 SMC family ATPase [Curtobacterium sp. MCSS17_016]
MRILSIEVEGLWSYRDRQRIDIANIPLLVGAGENGAGKSAIIVHAIIAAFYAKFPSPGVQADYITDGTTEAHVSVEFEHGGATYRIGRTFTRARAGGQGSLSVKDDSNTSGWRPLVSKAHADVTKALSELIGMDYDAATMTWISEQGATGKFPEAQPRDRFKLLSALFDLDVYDEKKKQAEAKGAELAKRHEALNGRIAELEHTLEQSAENTPEHAEQSDVDIEDALTTEQTRLDQVNTEVADLNSGDPERRVREAQAAYDVVNARRVQLLDEWNREVARFDRTRTDAVQRHQQATAQVDARLTAQLLAVDERTSASRRTAESQKQAATQALTLIADAESRLADVTASAADARQQAAQHRQNADAFGRQVSDHAGTRAAFKTEWDALKQREQDATKRLETLRTSVAGEHATCFTCNQHLSPADAQALITLTEQDLASIAERKVVVKDGGSEAGQAMNAAAANQQQETALAEQAERTAEQASQEQARMETVIAAKAERTAAKRDAEMVLLDLDTEADQEKAKAHDARDAEVASLDKAHQRELADIDHQAVNAKEQVEKYTVIPTDEQDLANALATARTAVAAEVAQVAAARQQLETRRNEIRERINVLVAERSRRNEAINQRRELKVRIDLLTKDRDALEREQETYKTLVKAFSQTGIPAMVLAGMMEQLNDSINMSLNRLSRGQMQVRLAASKDGAKNVSDNKVTVYVETPSGTRTYEALSGGQKFRVALAIRTGLAEAIARGTGAPVETFILDEGWGSLDMKGIIDATEAVFRLSETTNVLTVTHIPEVRDAFPNRVEVEMVGGSSVARVV